MTRKDTLIIAVLVNCALLIALCISALKRDSEEQVLTANTREALKSVVEAPVAKVEVPAAQGDEVDKVLQEFSAAQEAKKEKEGSVDFVHDLKPLLKAPEKKVAALPQRGIEITVRKGDALEKIARTHRTTVSEIVKLNNLTTMTLQIGQKLRIEAGKPTDQPLLPVANKQEEEAVYYTVISGDNPWTIAVKNRMKVDQLLKLNNLNEEKARRLKPGDRLRIR
jgi:LysM repeat protein